MSVGNFVVIVVFVFYVRYVFSLFKYGNRKRIKCVNEELDELRKIPVKTVEEQKRFMDLRYPKKEPFKFKFDMILDWVAYMVVMVGVYYVFRQVFNHFNINISIPMAVVIIIIWSLVMNFIFSKFGVERQSSLMNMFRGGKKK